VAAVLAVSLVVPSIAAADPPPDCPPAPAAYTGSDPVVSALTDERVDQRAACLAVTGRLDRAHDDATAAHTDATAAHTDAMTAHTDATAQLAHTDAVTDAVHAIPVPPAAGASYNGPSDTHAAALADELHVDVRGLQWLAWFLAGLLVVAIIRPSVSRWWGQ
jgi:hypothetical protein